MQYFFSIRNFSEIRDLQLLLKVFILLHLQIAKIFAREAVKTDLFICLLVLLDIAFMQSFSSGQCYFDEVPTKSIHCDQR